MFAGAIAGLFIGLGSAKYLQALLYEVKPTDPASLAFPGLGIIVAGLAASFLPLLRAAKIDPATILRAE